MRARSRNARSVISTRYAMLTAERFQRFPRRPDAAFSHILAALPDAFLGVCLGCDIEQTLIGCGVLHHRRGLAVDRQHHWAFGFLEVPEHLRGMVPKRGQCLDVPRDVDRRCSHYNTFKGTVPRRRLLDNDCWRVHVSICSGPLLSRHAVVNSSRRNDSYLWRPVSIGSYWKNLKVTCYQSRAGVDSRGNPPLGSQ